MRKSKREYPITNTELKLIQRLRNATRRKVRRITITIADDKLQLQVDDKAKVELLTD